MADFFESLNKEHIAFIEKQPVFFTATAPEEGRISLSPKGMDSLRCLNPRQVGYLDLVGSGNETAAHITQNGRMTIMFCSFDKQPLILRLYGKGEVIQPQEAAWEALSKHFPDYQGARQIIVLNIESLQTSCGYGVPRMEFIAERPTLKKWCEGKSEEALRQYQIKNNSKSIDGLKSGLALGKKSRLRVNDKKITKGELHE